MMAKSFEEIMVLLDKMHIAYSKYNNSMNSMREHREMLACDVVNKEKAFKLAILGLCEENERLKKQLEAKS